MPAPSNDAFASAIALSTTLPGTRTGDTTVDATGQVGSGEPVPFGGNDVQSVWYTYTPTSTGRYRFRLANTTTVVWTDVRQFRVSLYSGSTVGGLTEIVGVNKSGNSVNLLRDFAIVEALLTSGVTYHIRVASSFFTGDPANAHAINFDLHWESFGNPSAPANDALASAVDLGTDPVDGLVASPTTVGATDDGGFSYGNGFPSVWYKFHCATTESQEMHMVRDGADPFYVPYWEIYKKLSGGTPTSWSDLDFINNGDFVDNTVSIEDATVTVSLVAGNDYYIFVGNYNYDGTEGDSDFYFGAVAAPPTAPPNDIRTALNSAPLQNHHPYYLGRTEWVPYPGSAWLTEAQAGAVDGTTVAATTDGGEAAHGGYGPTRSVWYVLTIQKSGTYKIWAESAVDCVLSLYNKSGGSLGSSVAEDDDSGTGNWPEIIQSLAVGEYWIAVDSKTEGTFRLKWQLQTGGSHPANDNFASATVISSIPFSGSGTTIGATAEPDEREAEILAYGPKDTVWYKYVATFNGQLKIKGKCTSVNGGHAYVYIDCWHGTTLAGLVRMQPPDDLRGFFNFFDTDAQNIARSLTLPVQSGETYYIRVQTEEGGSETFDLNIGVESIFLDIQVSAIEGGPYSDLATIYLDLQVSAVEDFHQVIGLDAATIYLDIQPGFTYEAQGAQSTDSATIYINLVALGGECYSRFHFTGEGEADPRWDAVTDICRWLADDATRWSTFIESQPGCD